MSFRSKPILVVSKRLFSLRQLVTWLSSTWLTPLASISLFLTWPNHLWRNYSILSHHNDIWLRYQMGGIGKNGWIEFKLNDLTKWMNYFLNEHIWTNRIITTRKENRMVWHDMAIWRGCNVGDGVTGKMGRYKNKFQS
jgi:hypothetical protein